MSDSRPTESGSMSRLEYALRICCSPGKTVKIYSDNYVTAQKTFDRMCQLIPRQFVKRYGILSIIFENDSKIEVACR